MSKEEMKDDVKPTGSFGRKKPVQLTGTIKTN
jgi:hypothetical protein